MRIERKNTCVNVIHGEETLEFAMPNISAGKQRPGLTPTKNKRQTELEYFFEINLLWEGLSNKECDTLFSIYRDVYELSTADNATKREYMPKLTEQIVKMHPIGDIMKLFPKEGVWIPDDMKKSFDSVCPNYSQEMTYLVDDYYSLVCFGIAIRSLVPVLSAVGAVNTTTRNRSVEETRNTVYNTTYAYNLIMGTFLAEDPAVLKLDAFLSEAIVRIQKENKATSRGAASIALIAVFEGFGSEALQDYLRAHAIVNVLSNAILNPVHENSNHSRTTSLATSIYKGVMAEIKTNLAKKLTPDSFREKVPASKMRMFGEESKVSGVDLIRARSTAPIKVPVLSEVHICNYRNCIKTINPDLTPATAKIFIEHAANNLQFTHTLHDWLVSSILGLTMERKSFQDMRAESMDTAIGIAQADLVAKGYRELAILLSCSVVYSEDRNFVYSIDSMKKEFKDKLDIYYPQGFNETERGVQRKRNPAIENIELIINECIVPNRFVLNVSSEMADILHVDKDIEFYIPHANMRNDLAELLCRRAKTKISNL